MYNYLSEYYLFDFGFEHINIGIQQLYCSLIFSNHRLELSFYKPTGLMHL